MNKYFRTVLTIEVLTKTQAFNGDIAELHETITYGDASGMELVRVVEEVTEDEMGKLLIAQGSDPEFLIGDMS
jgi:hypothetical protein